MIKINLVWIFIFILYISSFLLFLIFNLIKIRKSKKSYSFLNQFPFEFLANKTSDIFLYIFVGLSFLPILLILPTFGEMGDLAIFNLVLTFLFGISGFFIASIFKISTLYLTPHFKVMTALFSMAFLTSALTALHFFLSFATYKRISLNGTYYLIFAIISTLLSALMLVLLFNPKLKNWANLETRKNDDSVTYVRPKFISLAYSEWISIAVITLSEILFLLSLLEI